MSYKSDLIDTQTKGWEDCFIHSGQPDSYIFISRSLMFTLQNLSEINTLFGLDTLNDYS